ncbi:MAG TPA: hypothetical protein VHB70_09395 [Parafilimonas sp.]|nr:hypothetical protein [Parafilimonas sp.]
MKTINRNNYEEFFLLYADNELDAETKLAVENFVQQNTDLAIELDMLLQTKSLPEEIVFNDKDLLLRTEGNNINESNYQEYFLMYIDNELSAAKREEVETYVLQHPKLQNEFTTLKQAMLAPEIVSYGDKKDLYRTEKRRVIYLRPWLFAAAAMFIGVCAVSFWLMEKPKQINTVAVIHPTEIKAKQNEVVKPVDTTQQQITTEQNTVAQQTLPSTENKIEKQRVAEKKNAAPVIVKHEETEIAQQKPAIHQPKIIDNNVKPDVTVKQITPQPVTENNDVAMETVPSNTNEQTQDENSGSNNGYKVYTASYKELNTSDDDNSLHVGAFDLNKTKVKNLFKKAGRLFGNKQNDLANDDGKLQVANFQIQTKEQ